MLIKCKSLNSANTHIKHKQIDAHTHYPYQLGKLTLQHLHARSTLSGEQKYRNTRKVRNKKEETYRLGTQHGVKSFCSCCMYKCPKAATHHQRQWRRQNFTVLIITMQHNTKTIDSYNKRTKQQNVTQIALHT